MQLLVIWDLFYVFRRNKLDKITNHTNTETHSHFCNKTHTYLLFLCAYKYHMLSLSLNHTHVQFANTLTHSVRYEILHLNPRTCATGHMVVKKNFPYLSLILLTIFCHTLKLFIFITVFSLLKLTLILLVYSYLYIHLYFHSTLIYLPFFLSLYFSLPFYLYFLFLNLSSLLHLHFLISLSPSLFLISAPRNTHKHIDTWEENLKSYWPDLLPESMTKH